MPGISGKKIVPLLYGTAVLMCGGLLWYGLDVRKTRAISPPLPAEDRAVLADLPREWIRITSVEGRGWVIDVPCHAGAGTLVVESGEESPRLTCTWCDTLQESVVRRVRLKGKPVKVRLKLDGGGTAWIEPADDAVAARFAGAPLRDYVLTWTAPGGEEFFFVPAEQAAAFDTLRAEDENPEGCGTAD